MPYLALGRLEDALGFWSRVNGAKEKLEIEASVRYDSFGDRERADWAGHLAERVSAKRGSGDSTIAP